MLGPTSNILVRIVEIAHAMPNSGFRNQPHEFYRSRLRDHSRIKRRLGLHYRKEQSRLNVVLLRRRDDCLLKFYTCHTTVIPGFAVNCCDRRICRYILMVYQSRGTDVSIEACASEIIEGAQVAVSIKKTQAVDLAEPLRLNVRCFKSAEYGFL
mgnify:CR=1 FL=1